MPVTGAAAPPRHVCRQFGPALLNTFSEFKRFDVSTVSDIRLPAGKEQ
jgi:hypothetical protein